MLAREAVPPDGPRFTCLFRALPACGTGIDGLFYPFWVVDWLLGMSSLRPPGAEPLKPLCAEARARERGESSCDPTKGRSSARTMTLGSLLPPNRSARGATNPDADVSRCERCGVRGGPRRRRSRGYDAPSRESMRASWTRLSDQNSHVYDSSAASPFERARLSPATEQGRSGSPPRRCRALRRRANRRRVAGQDRGTTRLRAQAYTRARCQSPQFPQALAACRLTP